MDSAAGGDAGSNLLQPGQEITPIIDKDLAKKFVTNLYGVQVKDIRELNAYDDKNFHILAEGINNSHVSNICEEGYVFKVMNSLDSKNLSLIEAQKEIMLYLGERGIRCPQPVPNIHNEFCSLEELGRPGGNQTSWHVVRLLEYQPGTLLHHVPCTKELFFDAGRYLAKLDKILKDFSHPAYESHTSMWALSAVPDLEKFLFAVKNSDQRKIASRVIDNFKNEVMEKIDGLEKGMLHGDFNEQNILCDQTSSGTWHITGILDFGDSHYSCYVFELAIAICYMMLQCKEMDPIEASGYVIAGYSTIRDLPAVELSILKTCIAARYVQSLVLGAYSYSLNPKNEYVMTTAKIGWKQLEYLYSTPTATVYSVWETIMNKYKT